MPKFAVITFNVVGTKGQLTVKRTAVFSAEATSGEIIHACVHYGATFKVGDATPLIYVYHDVVSEDTFRAMEKHLELMPQR